MIQLLFHIWVYIQRKWNQDFGKMFSVFAAPLFPIAKTQKKSESPWMEEKMVKMGYMWTMEYYSGFKNKKVLPFAAIWMNMKDIILKKISQTQDKYYNLHIRSNILKYIEIESGMVNCQGLGWGETWRC